MSRWSFDIAVIGAGPAGLCLAAALAARGVKVCLVDPRGLDSWTATYGVWADEIANSRLAGASSSQWRDTQVVIDGQACDLGRAYCRLDNELAQRRLAEELAGQTVLRQTVQRVSHDTQGATLALGDGSIVRARLVVDASGAGHFTERDGPAPSLFQLAYGARVQGHHPYSVDFMRLMDFSSEGVAQPGSAPSFLYAMPDDSGVFVEETSLVGRGTLSIEVLRERLLARLQRDGVAPPENSPVERVRIAMDVALPRLDQRVVAFGAAAALTHPATGYQVGRSLALAEPLAELLSSGLSANTPAQRLCRDAYDVLWPSDARLRHHLLRAGSRFLASLDTQRTQSFFRAFFSLPRDSWAGYLSGTLPSRELSAVMLSAFSACGGGLRLRLLWQTADRHTLSALRSLTLHRSA